MHRADSTTERLTEAIVRYSVDRTHLDPPPLDHPRTQHDLRASVGETITEHGIGGLAALRLFTDVLAPACISVDHPRFLSFVPAAPTDAAILFDLVVGASSIYGGSWMEGAGAVFAENQALRWIADLVGLPDGAGGVFVSGGTAGNLSALVAARLRWREAAGGRSRDQLRGIVLASAGAHSSVKAAAHVMDVEALLVPADERGRMTGPALRAAVASLSPEERSRVFAVVATSGTTNAGVIDDLATVAEVAASLDAWFHVDGAYGGAALVVPDLRHRFAGIEHCDSFIVDPHKWLFAPFDCCALVYRDPLQARHAHRQHAEYLDVLHDDEEWNPSDFAHHLSRRARGLPFWFSLAAHGTAAYREAVQATIALATGAARAIDDAAHVELLLEPELSIVLFRRVGWTKADYERWSEQALADGLAFVVPTTWIGETVLRFCFVNPLTSIDDITLILDSLR